MLVAVDGKIVTLGPRGNATTQVTWSEKGKTAETGITLDALEPVAVCMEG